MLLENDPGYVGKRTKRLNQNLVARTVVCFPNMTSHDQCVHICAKYTGCQEKTLLLEFHSPRHSTTETADLSQILPIFSRFLHMYAAFTRAGGLSKIVI